jgi:hypothetical protein
MYSGNETGGDRHSPNKAVMQTPAAHVHAHVLHVNVNEHSNPQVSPNE